MFFNVPVEGQVAIAVIAAVFLWSIKRWHDAYSRLCSTEWKPFQQLTAKKTPGTREEALLQINCFSKTSVLYSFFENAISSGKADLELFNYNEWIHWPRYFAGIFVFMGLLGTVWGIAHAVTVLGASVEGSSAVTSVMGMQSLARGIYNLLSGISYASVCTLTGLLATMIVSFLNSVFAHRAYRLTEQARICAETRFIPFAIEVKSRESIVISELQITVESLREVSQTLAASVYPASDYLAKVQKSTTTLVDQFQTSFIEFHNELKHTRELYKKISAMVAKIPEQSLISLQKSADDLTSVAQYFQTERDAVISAAGQVSSSANRMQDSIFKLQESMVTSAASQEEQLKSFTNEIKSTRSSLEMILRHFEQVLLDLSALPEQSALRKELISLAGELSQFGEILQSSSTIQNKAFAHHEMLSQEIQALHRHFSSWEASAQQLLDQLKQSSDFLSDDRFILDDKDVVLVGSPVSKRKSHAAGGNRYIDGSKFQSLWNKIREFWSNHS